MRVISGICRGFNLTNTCDNVTRSTSDFTKECMFNLIYNLHKPNFVLDLFAGSGALGIEALSRGAGFCTFVDNSKQSIRTINTNLHHTGFISKSRVIYAEAVGFLKRNKNEFDTIILDPPYKSDILLKILLMITENDILSRDGIIVLEHEKEAPEIPCLLLSRRAKYGRRYVSIYKKTQ